MRKNQLYYGDNLEIMKKYIADNSIDLCYIDPPFNSKRNYNQIYKRIGVEDKAQSQALSDTWLWDDEAQSGLEKIFKNDDKSYTLQTIALTNGFLQALGQGSMLAYIVSMIQRINEIYRILKPTGSFYLHCDPTMSHYLKIILDSVFCPRGGEFQNEIIWHYKTYQGNCKNHFPRKHDTIFFYTKSQNYYFKMLKDGNFKNMVDFKRWNKYLSHNQEIKGKFYPKTDSRFNGYYKKFVEKNGRIPRDNDVILKLEGETVDTVWNLKAVNPNSRERLGYTTQKPEKLLERIISASSKEGDTILDAYCGCGTTVSVAERMNRNWIGIDITYQAISLILKRLEDTYGSEVLENVETMGIPQDIESALALAHKKDDKIRKEFEKWAILTFSNNHAMINEKKGKDLGIDGTAYTFDGATPKKLLFSVKSGRVTSSQIRDLRGTIDRENAAGGILITLEEPTKDMKQEAIKAGRINNLFSAENHNKIEIVTIQEILDGKRMNIPVAGIIKSASRLEKPQGEQLSFA